ncbi:MAG: universal stress protein [Bacteroidales bacterium]|nr:universal stress protein [Bacteroidales bacterium]MCB9000195.1 universal stress protein [Bacteroidales bacterium]
MKNFIIPIDFSKESVKGLEIAVLFSKKMHVNIQMVYVQKSSEDYKPGTVEEEHKFAEAKFKEIVKEYGSKLGHDSSLKYIIKKGKIYKEVVNQVESYRDGVIAASTHGASGFEDFFIGSNAFKIICATGKPVITIRKGNCPDDIKTIVVALRMNVDTRQKVPWAADIAELFGAKIHLLSISSTKNKKDVARLKAYQVQSEEYLKKRKISVVSKQLFGDSLSNLTINYATAVDADLVVVGSSRFSGSSKPMGSYLQDILNHCPCPVLSITAGEKHVPIDFPKK